MNLLIITIQRIEDLMSSDELYNIMDPPKFSKQLHFDFLKRYIGELIRNGEDLTKLEFQRVLEMDMSLKSVFSNKGYLYSCMDSDCSFKINDPKLAAIHRQRFPNHQMSGPEGWVCTCGVLLQSPGNAADHCRGWGCNVFRFDERKTKKSKETSEWQLQKLYDYIFMFEQAEGEDFEIKLDRADLELILKLIGVWMN